METPEAKFEAVITWRYLFEALSMDVAEPFLSDSGFTVKRPEALKQIAREALDNASVSSIKSMADVDAALDRVALEMGQDLSEAIRAWREIAYDRYADREYQYGEWILALGRLADYFALTYPLASLQLPESKITALKLMFLKFIADVYRFRLSIAEAEQAIRSEWDARVYSTFPHGVSALDWIANQVSFLYRVEHWQEIRNLPDAGELAILNEWGKAQTALYPEHDPNQIRIPMVLPFRIHRKR